MLMRGIRRHPTTHVFNKSIISCIATHKARTHHRKRTFPHCRATAKDRFGKTRTLRAVDQLDRRLRSRLYARMHR